MTNNSVLILGGAGFIGSNLVGKYLEHGCKVTVLDGLLPKTSGSIKNLQPFISKIKFINKPIEHYSRLTTLIKNNPVVIDCMGWTFHNQAFNDPFYDIKLNVLSHLTLLEASKNMPNKLFIYLGSRGQYGEQNSKSITEQSSMLPLDVQGSNKLAAENLYRIYSNRYKLNVVSLRFPNCFGTNQPIRGKELGLIGSIIKDLIGNKDVEVYGKKRIRYILYVEDLVDIIYLISKKKESGFSAYNISGQRIYIEDLVKKIIKLISKGKLKLEETPEHIKQIDVGNSKVLDSKLRNVLGYIPNTDKNIALKKTLDYFIQNL